MIGGTTPRAYTRASRSFPGGLLMMREGAPVASRHTAWSADAGERVLRGLHEHDRLVLPALQALQAEFG